MSSSSPRTPRREKLPRKAPDAPLRCRAKRPKHTPKTPRLTLEAPIALPSVTYPHYVIRTAIPGQELICGYCNRNVSQGAYNSQDDRVFFKCWGDGGSSIICLACITADINDMFFRCDDTGAFANHFAQICGSHTQSSSADELHL